MATWTNLNKNMFNYFLLMEDGFYLLQETGFKIILNQYGWDDQTKNTATWGNQTKN